MIVSDLIAKLQTCNPNARVLVDKNNMALLGLTRDFMGEAIVLAQGVAFKLNNENSGGGVWVTQYPWLHEFPGANLTGISCVYIGSGDAIITPMWDKK